MTSATSRCRRARGVIALGQLGRATNGIVRLTWLGRGLAQMLFQIARDLFVTGPRLAELLAGPIAPLIGVWQGVGQTVQGVASLVLVAFDVASAWLRASRRGPGRSCWLLRGPRLFAREELESPRPAGRWPPDARAAV